MSGYRLIKAKIDDIMIENAVLPSLRQNLSNSEFVPLPP
jgi:hypothetical protein